MTDQPDYALVSGLIAQLPEDGRWTRERRDRWMQAFTAMLDLVVECDDWALPPLPPPIRTGLQPAQPWPMPGPVVNGPAANGIHFTIDGRPFSIPPLVPGRRYTLTGMALAELVDADQLWRIQTFAGPEGDFDSLVPVEELGEIEVAAGDRFTTKGVLDGH